MLRSTDVGLESSCFCPSSVGQSETDVKYKRYTYETASGAFRMRNGLVPPKPGRLFFRSSSSMACLDGGKRAGRSSGSSGEPSAKADGKGGALGASSTPQGGVTFGALARLPAHQPASQGLRRGPLLGPQGRSTFNWALVTLSMCHRARGDRVAYPPLLYQAGDSTETFAHRTLARRW